MDELDRQRTAYALGYYRTGEAFVWVNPDTGLRSRCVPESIFRGAQGPCRPFTVWADIDGEEREIRGTACRQPDGSWRMLEEPRR